MGKTIMIVDDHANVRTLVSEYLSEQGFRVVSARDGMEALEVAQREYPDLILLDVMMPNLDGFEFMRIYRKSHNIPVILLTARLAETDKVVGLELGADDYVTKPFGMAELVARIRAVLRRINADVAESQVLRIGDVVLDRTARTVMINDHPVTLTRSEFDLMTTLMATPERVFS